MNKIEIVRPKSPLERESWSYWFDERIPALVLDRYAHEKRASTRHRNWEQIVEWTRIQTHHSRASGDQPRIDASVDAEAVEQFRAVICVAPIQPPKNDGYRRDRR